MTDINEGPGAGLFLIFIFVFKTVPRIVHGAQWRWKDLRHSFNTAPDVLDISHLPTRVLHRVDQFLNSSIKFLTLLLLFYWCRVKTIQRYSVWMVYWLFVTSEQNSFSEMLLQWNQSAKYQFHSKRLSLLKG